MKEISIHSLNVSYDDSHERVRNFVEYLKSGDRKEELRAYYTQAKNSANQKIHLNDRYDNEYTLEYKGDSHCYLRLREI